LTDLSLAPGALLDLVAIVLVGIGTVLDLRTRRIPDRLTGAGAGLGLILGFGLGGVTGAQQAAVGLVVGLFLLLAPCLLGWVGGGYLKLLAAVGALQGPATVVRVGLYGMLLGGVLSIGFLLIGSLRRKAANVAAPTRALPYGPALAAGTICAILAG
jgi:prepilin peptidase CpaA